MSLATQITLLAQAIALDIKDIGLKMGALTTLTTADKTNLVNAVNELNSKIGTLINDAAGAGVSDKTWSADKILAYTAQLKSDIMGGLPSAALDTITELAAHAEADATAISNVLAALGNRVRFDAVQSLNTAQQQQARENTGSASALIVTTLTNNVGDTATDFVTAYNTSKA